MTITVNDVAITDEDVAREVQYHPADSLAAAQQEAARTLVIRQLLLQRAAELGIAEADEEAAVEALLRREISLPEPDDAACRRYYDNNRRRFRARDLFEAAHILLPAAPDDAEARSAAKQKAKELIRILLEHPERFPELAARHSACPSAADGGHLGQISPGETNPEFETFLYHVEPGTICAVPVPSRHGYHVLRLDRRQLGEVQPFAAVRDAIAADLRRSAWTRAVRQYIQLLAGRAAITGFDLDAAESPLVQ